MSVWDRARPASLFEWSDISLKWIVISFFHNYSNILYEHK